MRKRDCTLKLLRAAVAQLEVIKTERELDSAGICYNLSEKLMRILGFEYYCSCPSIYRIVSHFAKGWEHHTGCPAYPVPGTDRCRMWEGEQLKLRLDLICYLQDQINKHIATRTKKKS